MENPRQSLAGTLTLLVASVGLLLAAALGNDGPPPEPAPVAAQASPVDPGRLLALSRQLTPAVARRVEAIRELRFERTPRPEVSSTARLRRVAERALDRRRVQAEVRAANAELRLLGLLEPGASLQDVATDAQSLASAYYAPRRDRLYVVGDSVPAGRELTEFILAHELTHALEDQRFGLPGGTGGVSDDRALARSALVEGTATSLMLDYAARHLDPLALAADASAVDAGTGGLPRFALEEIEFTYFAGSDFIAALRGIAGDWRLVDHAYQRRPPVTTEQILHPDRYTAGEGPLPVPPPPPPGPGWRRVDGGVVGEFATIQILRVGLDEDRARAAAEGWGGDSYALWRRTCPPGAECDREHALGVVWRWDSRRQATQFERALRGYVTDGLEGQPEGDAVWAVRLGNAALTRRGDMVALGLAPTPGAARRAATPG